MKKLIICFVATGIYAFVVWLMRSVGMDHGFLRIDAATLTAAYITAGSAQMLFEAFS